MLQIFLAGEFEEQVMGRSPWYLALLTCQKSRWSVGEHGAPERNLASFLRAAAQLGQVASPLCALDSSFPLAGML